MSKLEDLIKELCPNGVEYKILSEICKIERGDRITKRDITEKGEYPVISGGQFPMGKYGKYNREANTITISSYGAAGFVGFQTEKFWANDVCLCLYPDHSLENKFLYYYLTSIQQYLYTKTTKAIPDHIPTSVIKELQIPVPPLGVQREIVRILDNFTLLSTELKAELTARRKQYEFFRDKFLLFDNELFTKTSIGEQCNIVTDFTAAGSFADLANKVVYKNEESFAQLVRTIDIKSNFTKGEPVYVDETAFNYLWRVNFDKDCIILPNIGVNCGEIYYVKYGTLPYKNNVLGPNAIMIKDTKCNIRYLFYVLQTDDFQDKLHKIISPGGQTKFNKTDLKMINFYIPSIQVQNRIVEVLDYFDTICSDLGIGLPAEIEKRQKQYEYYRDKLLKF